VGVLEWGDDVDAGARAERVRIGHLQHDRRLGRLVLGDLRDEQVGTGTVAELAGVVVGLELQGEAQRLEELGCLAPVVGRQVNGFDALGRHIRSPSQTMAAAVHR
jgi:hypothetical protein